MNNNKLKKFLKIALEYYDEKLGISLLNLINELDDVEETVSLLLKKNYVKIKYYLRGFFSLIGPFPSKRQALEVFYRYVEKGKLPLMMNFENILEAYLIPTEKFFDELLPSHGLLVKWTPTSKKGFYHSLYKSILYVKNESLNSSLKGNHFQRIIFHLIKCTLESKGFSIHSNYEINSNEKIDVYCEKGDGSRDIWIIEAKYSDKPFIKDEGSHRPIDQLINYVEKIRQIKLNIKSIVAILMTNTLVHPEDALRLFEKSRQDTNVHFYIFELYHWLMFFKEAIRRNYDDPYNVLEDVLQHQREPIFRYEKSKYLEEQYNNLWNEYLRLQAVFH
ncbi:MAG: hypothetical protein B6U76_07475 [Desulfurococcales archaeon ex4484_217_2]|nr:MAG: hypothetical protein B6U76_07475 [Desulfurococcales archaeon ex4484_217_2]